MRFRLTAKREADTFSVIDERQIKYEIKKDSSLLASPRPESR